MPLIEESVPDINPTHPKEDYYKLWKECEQDIEGCECDLANCINDCDEFSW